MSKRDISVRSLGGAPFLFMVFLLIIGLPACEKDKEDVNPIPAEIRSVNNFILENMELYYLWEDKIPESLNPNQEPDPEAFFEKMIFKTEDRFSYITDDYEALIKSFQGINKSFGHKFRLFKYQSSDNIFGIVEYVVTDSPAERAGIFRGNVFTRVNGQQLTTSNYSGLLFSQESYTLEMADWVGSELVLNGITITLVAEEVVEDPVYYANIFEMDGKRIGYLVYNQFISSRENELRNMMAAFRTSEVSEFILDLRYNPGGSVNTARILASMLAPIEIVTDGGIFIKYLWNSLVEDYFLEEEGPNSENLILKFNAGESTNNLHLQRIYILTSDNTASASELIINSLKPYMEVILIGTTTVGKNLASITIHDQEKSFNWAIQPIVLKLANANDESEYGNGFIPDHIVEDDYFSPLGSLEEDLLAKAVSLASGIPEDQLARKPELILPDFSVSLFSASDEPVSRKQLMYIE